MKRRVIQILSVLLCFVTVFSCFAVNTSAAAFTYKKAANDVSSAYKNSKFYKNLTQIELTGDGVTDVLAVALSQMSYVEGTNESGFNGTQGGGGNYTEYTYNMGKVTGYSYAWCAAFVSWCLLQSGCTNQNTQGAWCRNHMGDKTYIWREIGCYRWYNQLKNFGYGHAADGKYTPKPGDLIFFESSEHIGIVRYSKDGTVYTIEGNTGNAAGVNADGGGVYCKSYKITGGKIRGFGALPYKENKSAPKVDYTGANPTTGLWISESNKYLYPDTTLNDQSNYTTIPKGTIFEVTKIISKTCFEAKYNGKTGYVSVNSSSPIFQVTSNVGGGVVETETTAKKTTAKVVANKYAINDDLKKVKEHIGSGITQYAIDGEKVEKAESFTITANQKLGLTGYAGFTAAINEFGYYFDGDQASAVTGIKGGTASSSIKQKAGDKAKSFDVSIDASALADGAHTVTLYAKLSSKTVELTTITLNVGASGIVDVGCADGSESASESGGAAEAEAGCSSTVAFGIAVPVVALAGAVIFKRKKED